MTLAARKGGAGGALARRLPPPAKGETPVRSPSTDRTNAGATYRVIAVWRDSAVIRAESFDAVDLELAALWADVDIDAAR